MLDEEMIGKSFLDSSVKAVSDMPVKCCYIIFRKRDYS
jgi:hypothetical protein